jgi:urease accessory protein
MLAHLHQKTPCRVLFPRPETGDIPAAVLLTTSGGLTGGDSLRIAIEASPEAHAVVTTQAAEKIYRARDGEAAIEVALEVHPGAWLEWLPQETILFDRAHLRRRTSARVAPGGRLLAGEIVIFGRRARGERFAEGLLHDSWRVRRGGVLAWADALHLEEDIARTLDHPAGFDRAVAVATLVYVGDDASDRLDLARALLAESAGRAGATIVGGLLLVRLLGRDARLLREDFMRLCKGLRAALAGLPARMPRVWAI